jgi:hypothetical protein
MRQSKEDYYRTALDLLAEGGVDALTIANLCTRLVLQREAAGARGRPESGEERHVVMRSTGTGDGGRQREEGLTQASGAMREVGRQFVALLVGDQHHRGGPVEQRLG